MHCLLFPTSSVFCFFFQPSTARLENDKLNRHTYDNLRHLFEIDYAFSILQLPVYSSIEHGKTKHNKLLLKFGSLHTTTRYLMFREGEKPWK